MKTLKAAQEAAKEAEQAKKSVADAISCATPSEVAAMQMLAGPLSRVHKDFAQLLKKRHQQLVDEGLQSDEEGKVKEVLALGHDQVDPGALQALQQMVEKEEMMCTV